MSERQFEVECGLTRSTLNAAKGRNVELSDDNINKVVERFSTEFEAAGFEIVDLKPYGRNGYGIVPASEKKPPPGKNDLLAVEDAEVDFKAEYIKLIRKENKSLQDKVESLEVRLERLEKDKLFSQSKSVFFFERLLVLLRGHLNNDPKIESLRNEVIQQVKGYDRKGMS